MKTAFAIQFIFLALTTSVLAAPLGSSENPANALKKRAYNLTCNGGQYYTCRDYYNTVCSGSGRPISNNPTCERICNCDWIYECPGFGGCLVATVPEADSKADTAAEPAETPEAKA